MGEEFALCRDRGLAGVFFSTTEADIAHAQLICAQCPVKEPCLRYALSAKEPAGIWGGEIIHQGRIILDKRRAGRPSKYQARRFSEEIKRIPQELQSYVI